MPIQFEKGFKVLTLFNRSFWFCLLTSCRMPLEVFPHVYVSRITASMFCTFQYLESLPPVLPECGKDKRCGIYHEVLLLDCGSFQFVSNKGMQLLRMGCLTERSSARLYQYFWDYAHTKGPPSYLDDLKIQRRPV